MRIFALIVSAICVADTPENDWSVCTTWILAPHKRWYLVDVWRGRVDYPALKMQVQTLAKRWEAQRVLVEDTGAGTSLVQELKGWVSGIIAVKAEGDKVSRMAVASAKFEAGQALLPERARIWLDNPVVIPTSCVPAPRRARARWLSSDLT